MVEYMYIIDKIHNTDIQTFSLDSLQLKPMACITNSKEV